LSFLNFVIRLSDDSDINEKFLSLTTGEKYKTPKELEFMDILSIYLSICTFKGSRNVLFKLMN